MYNIKVALNEISPEGRTLTVDNPTVWSGPVVEFGLPLRVTSPLSAEMFILPQEDGCLLRGQIRGEISLPCDRCAEDARIAIDHTFDDFEEYPCDPSLESEGRGTQTEEIPEDGVITLEKGAPVLDVSVLLWEEFSLALPVKPLCSPHCRGVCPQCGKNLNEGPCACPPADGDPRLAALRQFKVKQ